MIARKSLTYDFQQRLSVEKQIARRNGYELNNQPLLDTSLSHSRQERPLLRINFKVNPLQVENAQLPISEKFKKVLKQIEVSEIQKKLNNNQSNAIGHAKQSMQVEQFINGKINHFNAVVDHCHLKPRNPNERGHKESFLNPQNEGKSKEKAFKESSWINQCLNDLSRGQHELRNSSNLASKYSTSQQMIRSYRKFSDAIKSASSHHIPAIKANKHDHSSFQVKNLQEQQILPSNHQAKQRSFLQLQEPSREPELDVNQPYLSARQMKQTNDLGNQCQQLVNLMPCWNNRFQEEYNSHLPRFSPSGSVPQKHPNSRFSNTSNIREGEKTTQQASVPASNIANQHNRVASHQIHAAPTSLLTNHEVTADKEDSNKSLQRKFLSTFLKRRNHRYVKSPQNNSLIRYNENTEAEQMLSGEPPNNPKKKLSEIKYKYKPVHSRKFKIPKDASQDEQLIVQHMLEEESDVFYWKACRNEKMNLLLKGKKRSR